MSNNSDEILHYLRDYINDSLSPDQKEKIEQLIEQDPEVRKELEWTQILMAGTEAFEKQRILAHIESVSREVQSEIKAEDAIRPRRNNRILLWVSVAASVLLILGFGGFNFWLENTLDDFPETSYAKIENSLNRSIEDSPDKEIQIQLALQDYNDGNYNSSIEFLEAYNSKDSLFALSLFLKSHNYYKVGKFNEAQALLDTLDINKLEIIGVELIDLKMSGSSIRDNIRWTKILILLQQWRTTKSDVNKNELKQKLSKFLESPKLNADYYNSAKRLNWLLSYR